MTLLKGIGLLLSGALCGFFSSSPPGPINLIVADSVIGVRPLHRNAFITGVILAELVLAAIAFWGYHRFFQEPAFQRWAPLIGGIFVMALGIGGLFAKGGRKDDPDQGSAFSGRKKGGDFLQGLFLCGSNPAFLVFWIYVMSALSYSGLAEGIPLKSLFLLAGIAIGNALWFGLFIRFLHRGADRVNKGLLPWLRRGISLALIALGLFGVLVFI